MTIFKTYKETLNKNQLKQFEQIENNIKNIIITDDDYLNQLNTFIDKKIKTLRSILKRKNAKSENHLFVLKRTQNKVLRPIEHLSKMENLF